MSESALKDTAFTDPKTALAWLLSPKAIRARADFLFERARAGQSAHFSLDLGALETAADFVAQVIRENYPTLDIPYHARWRHFGAGGIDRWAQLAATLGALDKAERARLRFDLAVTSVLLDAGAGAAWAYTEGGRKIARSEGLAVASFHAFTAGLFSSDPAQPLRADAAALSRIEATDIGRAFQVRPENRLEGQEGRAALMRNLGAALKAKPALFGTEARIGRLYDYLAAQAREGELPATAILSALLEGLSPIWPGRIELAGVNLGDCWRHSAVKTSDLTDGLVPFHKLSQWLAYSLVEPLEEAGIRVTGLDGLTGLPEYRNGGLFIDTGVLTPKDPARAAKPLAVDDELVVEWRALTVALLDRIADPVRRRLGKTAAEMPLARILEGGTWAAGRKIAAQKRPSATQGGGGPPLNIISDGTVF